MTTKSGTVAERPTFFRRTSDDHGSYLKNDMDTYLTLVRQKIQEKCNTTRDLITLIRRNKISDHPQITPGEFKITLCKFNIMFPQSLVDQIFNIFDSDRSGTMDFDEFAMWIMNSEFKPSNPHLKKDVGDSPKTILRKKLLSCIQQNPRLFHRMKRSVSFIEFISDMNNIETNLSEVDIRMLFMLLDPENSGFIDTNSLKVWAETGNYSKNAISSNNFESAMTSRSKVSNDATQLKQILNRVVGVNTIQFKAAFAHIEMGVGNKLNFEEFRRCLLNGGVTKNVHDLRQVFMALGGDRDGLADVDLLFRHLSPEIANPSTEVSLKPKPTVLLSSSRADRRLRDSLRKSYPIVKKMIEKEDPQGSGFISISALHGVLTKHCMPLPFEDLRFILQSIKKQPGDREFVDYNHFLRAFNPIGCEHQFLGLMTIRRAAESRAQSASHTSGVDISATTSSSSSSSSFIPALTNSSSSNNFTQHPFRSEFPSATRVSTAPAGMSRKASRSIFEGEKSHDELASFWRAALRECQRNDRDKNGFITRPLFISSIQSTDVHKVLSLQNINSLADEYSISSGMINYQLLFRRYLLDITRDSSERMLEKIRQVRESEAERLRKEAAAAAAVVASSSHSSSGGQSSSKFRLNPLPGGTAVIASTMRSDSYDNLTQKHVKAYLAPYSHSTVQLLQRCYDLFKPVWRSIRSQFAKHQLEGAKGVILTAKFVDILENHSIVLSKKDLGIIVKNFRASVGELVDAVRFDDFLRICMATKDLEH